MAITTHRIIILESSSFHLKKTYRRVGKLVSERTSDTDQDGGQNDDTSSEDKDPEILNTEDHILIKINIRFMIRY